MKQYAAYKPSGDEWLGDVPSHWATIRADFVTESLKVPVSEAEMEGREIVHYSIPAVQEFGGPIIEPGDDVSSGKLLISRQQLLISKLNPRKSTLCIAEPTKGMLTVASTEFVPIVPLQGVEMRYAFYVWGSSKVTHLLAGIVRSVTRSHQRAEPHEIRKILWAWPPLPEQRAITAFLDERTAHLDGLIRRKEELLELLAEQRAAGITRAVTRGLDAAAPLQESGVPWLGQVPAHWLITRLKFIADVHSGIAKGKKYLPTQELVEVPYLRVANVQDGYLKLDDITTISVTPAEAKSYELRPQDILMNEGGDNDKLGRGTVWEGQVAPCIHQNHVFAIRHHGKVDSWFLSYFFGSTACKPYFLLSGNQATNLASISASAISDTPLALPPLAEQREIVVAINQGNERLDKMTDITTREIAKLREYRAALITAAVTGRIDVRAGVAAAEPTLAEAL